MATITIPSSSTLKSSPVLQPSIEPPKTPKAPAKAPKKQLKPYERSWSKTEGVAKPKQSKSRNGKVETLSNLSLGDKRRYGAGLRLEQVVSRAKPNV